MLHKLIKMKVHFPFTLHRMDFPISVSVTNKQSHYTKKSTKTITSINKIWVTFCNVELLFINLKITGGDNKCNIYFVLKYWSLIMVELV